MIVVPIRSFRDGKTRLAHAVDDGARVELIRSWAASVVTAAHDLPVVVVSGDTEVLEWASELGLAVIRQRDGGLDRAAELGRDAAIGSDATRVMIAHADLPFAKDLRPVFADPHQVTIVADGGRDGTNVIVLPLDRSFRFAYGPGSFRRHLDEAARLKWSVGVIDDPDLAIDIDDADDLARLRATRRP